ncbi:prolipoprotein diacylglyceryl transferase [Limibacter armeniacum]|uniref:prolipoprotein diacylglyceryl transferase n=1 Tax=Limibacter armeniacum TaxID=466084 RepID=UPI002FE6509C
MDILAFIEWAVKPEIISKPIEVRWYGLLFALGFFIGQSLMTKIYKQEGKPESGVDSLTIYVLIATVLGARLGHCLFYDPDYYLAHPVEILMVWKGGLASHGAAIGILIGLWMYSRKFNYHFLWVVDRVVIMVALGGAFIRLGNLMNSEIVGIPTDVPWAFIFERLGDNTPRHPVQLYESLTYFATFAILWGMYKKFGTSLAHGRLFGVFLIMVFGSRIIWEMFKVHQAGFMEGVDLRMGQLLSIPLVLAGLYLLFKSNKGDTVEQEKTKIG